MPGATKTSPLQTRSLKSARSAERSERAGRDHLFATILPAASNCLSMVDAEGSAEGKSASLLHGLEARTAQEGGAGNGPRSCCVTLASQGGGSLNQHRQIRWQDDCSAKGGGGAMPSRKQHVFPAGEHHTKAARAHGMATLHHFPSYHPVNSRGSIGRRRACC